MGQHERDADVFHRRDEVHHVTAGMAERVGDAAGGQVLRDELGGLHFARRGWRCSLGEVASTDISDSLSARSGQ